jgi:hypothetical protein
VQLESEGELVPPVPSIVGQQRRSGGQIRQRGDVRRRRLGAFRGQQVQLRDLLAFLETGDERRATVELVHDVKDAVGTERRGESSSDSEMHRRTRFLGHERTSGLLHAVVHEAVRRRRPLDELLLDRLRERGVDVNLRARERDRGRCDVDLVAEARELLERRPDAGRQATELAHHQVDDVVRVSRGVQALEIPAPAAAAVVELQQAFVSERVQELDDEEWSARRLLVYELGQRCDPIRLGPQRIGDQPPDVVARERCELDIVDGGSGATHRLERARERVRVSAFILPIARIGARGGARPTRGHSVGA